MAREPWSKETRNFMYDMLSSGIAGARTDQAALATKLSDEDTDRLLKAGIVERQAGSILYRFGEGFSNKMMATIMEKFFPGQKDAAETRKSGRVRGPEYVCLFALKQALKTMRAEMEDGLKDDNTIREVWANLCINDEGFFLIPATVLYDSGGNQTGFTAGELEQYRISLEPTGE